LGEPTTKNVAVIIPAKDEESRIANVLKAVCASKLATEIIVVDDGSCDNTAVAARRIPGVRVLELPFNQGKAGAMAAGAHATKASILAFVDADLEGLTGDHVDKIIKPILAGECEMCVGIFRGGKTWSDNAQKIAPYLSGQRALRRELFESVPNIKELRWGIEWALNDAAKRRKSRVLRVVLHGVSNCAKEQKLGAMKGTAARAKMYYEIAQAMVKNKRSMRTRRPKPPRRPWL
jgi:glycosyltransferase involved in cell wall biosynthesis